MIVKPATVGFVFVVLVLTAQPNHALDTSCQVGSLEGMGRDPANCVDLGPVDELTISTIAKKLAPVLWFSPDEPLRKPVPEKLPVDSRVVPGRRETDDRVAYFRVLRAKHGPDEALQPDV